MWIKHTWLLLKCEIGGNLWLEYTLKFHVAECFLFHPFIEDDGIALYWFLSLLGVFLGYAYFCVV